MLLLKTQILNQKFYLNKIQINKNFQLCHKSLEVQEIDLIEEKIVKEAVEIDIIIIEIKDHMKEDKAQVAIREIAMIEIKDHPLI